MTGATYVVSEGAGCAATTGWTGTNGWGATGATGWGATEVTGAGGAGWTAATG